MNLNAAKAEYDQRGFVIIPNFLTLPELAEVQSELDRYISQVVPGLPDSHAFYQDRSRPETLKQMQFMQVDPFFQSYTRHTKWKRLAETLIGEAADCESPEWFNKPAGVEHPTPPHQDNYYFNLQPANVITNPVLDLAVDESTWAVTGDQLPLKSASHQKSKDCALGL